MRKLRYEAQTIPFAFSSSVPRHEVFEFTIASALLRKEV